MASIHAVVSLAGRRDQASPVVPPNVFNLPESDSIGWTSPDHGYVLEILVRSISNRFSFSQVCPERLHVALLSAPSNFGPSPLSTESARRDGLHLVADKHGLSLWRTGYSSVPIYLHLEDQTLYTSSEMTTLEVESCLPSIRLPSSSVLRMSPISGQICVSDCCEPIPRPDPSLDVHEAVNDLQAALMGSLSFVRREAPCVLFSGGLDSSLLACACARLSSEVRLMTCAAAGSSDYEWAPEAADLIGRPLSRIEMTDELVWESLPTVIYATGRTSTMDVEIALCVYLAATKALQSGSLVVSGQGPDELFAGYARHARLLDERGPREVENMIRSDVMRTADVNLDRDRRASLAAGCEIVFPYMTTGFVNSAMRIPIEMKISPEGTRKAVFRQLARSMGLPAEISERPKKATQYSSGCSELLIETVRDRVRSDSGWTRRRRHRIVQSVLDKIGYMLGIAPPPSHADDVHLLDDEPILRLLDRLERAGFDNCRGGDSRGAV